MHLISDLDHNYIYTSKGAKQREADSLEWRRRVEAIIQATVPTQREDEFIVQVTDTWVVLVIKSIAWSFKWYPVRAKIDIDRMF